MIAFALFFALPAPAVAALPDIVRVGVRSAEIGWDEPTGSFRIDGYLVSVSRNGAPEQFAALVTEPRYTIEADYGDDVVATVRTLGRLEGQNFYQASAPSPPSPRFQFVPGRTWPGEGFLALHCEECEALEVRDLSNTTLPEILPGHGAPWEVVGIADMHASPGLEVLWYEPSAERIEITGLEDGAPRATPNIAMQGRVPLGLVDTDGDGRPEVVVRVQSNGKIEIWKVLFGWLVRANTLTAPLDSVLISGEDFDGDGTGDLWWQTQTGDLEIWKMIAWQYAGVLAQRSNPGTGVLTRIGDFDGNGTPDALWRASSGVLQITYFGPGAAADRTLGWTAGDSLREVRAVADLDGQPGVEILVQNRNTLSVEVVHPTSFVPIRDRLIDMTDPWLLVDAHND